MQAQDSTKSSDQTKTIEIDNENGELYISFKNNVISKFIINDTPVPPARYGDYQDIIDDFAQEDVEPNIPTPPVPPTADRDSAGELYTFITEYLADNELIKSDKKFKIQLKSNYLKVNGQKMTPENRDVCLQYFEEVYGHPLNDKSEVKFRKSKRSYKSSINISE